MGGPPNHLKEFLKHDVKHLKTFLNDLATAPKHLKKFLNVSTRSPNHLKKFLNVYPNVLKTFLNVWVDRQII